MPAKKKPKSPNAAHPSGPQERITVRLAPAYMDYYRRAGKGVPSAEMHRVLIENAKKNGVE